MSAILKFDFHKKKTIMFFWIKLSKLHKNKNKNKNKNKWCGNYIFPQTRGNQNK